MKLNTLNRLIPTLFLVILLISSGTLKAQINFTKSILNGTDLHNPTSLQIGPDGRLYIAQQNGTLKIMTLARNAADDYTVTATEEINLIGQIKNHNDDGTQNPGVYGRQVTGLYVAGTAANPIIYVSSSDPRMGGGGGGGAGDVNLDTNSGILSMLTWNGGAWEKLDLVRGFPRSEENHAPNGLQVDGDMIYLAIGGFTNAGAPSLNFAYANEYALSACVLSIDLAAIMALPTQTDGYGQAFKYNLPTLDDPDRGNVSGTSGYTDNNDPWGGNDGLNQAKWVDGGPVQVYATGFRNPYDLVIAQDGKMYTIDNGANLGWGGYPENEGPPPGGVSYVTNNYVDGEPGYVNNQNGLHYITGAGYYGGHPNPIRANPANAGLYTHDGTNGVWRTEIGGGNPLPADWPPVPAYMANPTEGDFQQSGEGDGTLINYGASTNGMCEYTASNFGGAMQGDILSVSFLGQIFRTKLNESSTEVMNGVEELAPGIANSLLDIVAQGDSDPFPGTIWACNYADNTIHILEPMGFCESNPNSTSAITFTVDPPGDTGLNASSHIAYSFHITNESTDGQQVEKIILDLSSTLLPDLLFDPNGNVGDDLGLGFSPDPDGWQAGYDGFSYLEARDYGHEAIEIYFEHFEPGETYSFTIEIDPTSIQGSTSPGLDHAGAVSGLELTGATVKAEFTDCAKWTSRLFPVDGSEEAATVCLNKDTPDAPTLELMGLTRPNVTVPTPNHTARINGPVGATARLFIMEASLYLDGDGYDLDAYEGNSAVNVTQMSLTIGADGYVDVPITLTKTNDDGGWHYLAAVIGDGACTSDLSNEWRVKYDTDLGAVAQTIYINRGMSTTPDAIPLPFVAFNETTTFSSKNAIIELEEGQMLNLTVVNNDTKPHNVQMEGQDLDPTPIPAGGTKTYSMTFTSMGTHIFYDDLEDGDNKYMGLSGIVNVQTFGGETFFWNMKEHHSLFNFILNAGGNVDFDDYEPDYFSINGLSFPQVQDDEDALLSGNVGVPLRLVLANTGLMKHSIHFHGYHAQILYSSKYASHVGRSKDTFPIDQMETLILELVPDKPGIYPVHDHNVVAVTGGGEYPNGMIVVFLIEE